MEATDAVNTGIHAAGKTAGMVVDYGMLVMVGAILLLALGAILFLAFRYWNRRIGGDYIEREKVLEYVREKYPDALRTPTEALPRLTEHPVFALCTNAIRAAESTLLRDATTGGILQPHTDMVRDLLAWTLRGTRSICLNVVTAAYEHKDGFEKSLGDKQRFASIAMETYATVEGAVRQRLVEEFDFPAMVYDAWRDHRREADNLMADMVELAASQHDTNYWRMVAVLNSVYARVMVLHHNVFAFIRANPEMKGVTYTRPAGASDNTFTSNRQTKGDYVAKAFSESWRPKL